MLCITVTVDELFLEFCACFYRYAFLIGADASLLVKNMSVMRSRQALAKTHSSMPIAAALP